MKQVGPALGLFLLSCARPSPQEPAPGRLLFEDDFSDLRHWSVEGTGTATVQEGTFVWDASGTREGTAWCRQRFAGSTLVTYEVQVLDGRSNINFFAYGGRYYSFHHGGWFVATKHGGPWVAVAPGRVPQPVLAVPVAYYKVPPGHPKKMHHPGLGCPHGLAKQGRC